MPSGSHSLIPKMIVTLFRRTLRLLLMTFFSTIRIRLLVFDLSTVDLEPATPTVDQGPITTLQGTFTVDGAGNLTFAPIADFNGTVVRQYTVKNNESPTPQTSNEATVSVTVLPVMIRQQLAQYHLSLLRKMPWVEPVR